MWHVIVAQVVLIWTAITVANVEKTIFLAPEAVNVPQDQLNLDQLQLEILNPTAPTLHRQLRAAFPTPTEPEGPTTWFLLDSLKPYQRFEIRICWLATVRTTFQEFLRCLFLCVVGTLTRYCSNQQISQSTLIGCMRFLSLLI